MKACITVGKVKETEKAVKYLHQKVERLPMGVRDSFKAFNRLTSGVVPRGTLAS